MSEKKVRYNTASLFVAALVGAGALAGCSSQSNKNTTPTSRPTPTSLIPPVAQPGEVFSCIINSQLNTLTEAGIAGAAKVLSKDFHETPTKFLANARYGFSICQLSLTKEMADTEGFVVEVPDEPRDTCITWTVVYGDKTEAQIGGATNHIGLICVPKPTVGSTVTSTSLAA